MKRIGRACLLGSATALLCAAALAACSDGEPALLRGDRLWADSQFDNALAEYRLAVAQSGGAEPALLRTAHAYALAADFENAREHYDQLLSRAPEHTPQAIRDYLVLAERARRRGDRYGMATAVESALALDPELGLAALNEPMADYYLDTGNPQRALVFYRRALKQLPPDSTRHVLFLIGEVYADMADCLNAIDYFHAYRVQAPRGERASEARWQEGNCAFQLGQDAYEDGVLTDALKRFETVVELGVPESVQEEAWFQVGEIRYALGRFDEALEAYNRVLELNPRRIGRFVDQARERIDDIRFREPLDDRRMRFRSRIPPRGGNEF